VTRTNPTGRCRPATALRCGSRCFRRPRGRGGSPGLQSAIPQASRPSSSLSSMISCSPRRYPAICACSGGRGRAGGRRHRAGFEPLRRSRPRMSSCRSRSACSSGRARSRAATRSTAFGSGRIAGAVPATIPASIRPRDHRARRIRRAGTRLPRQCQPRPSRHRRLTLEADLDAAAGSCWVMRTTRTGRRRSTEPKTPVERANVSFLRSGVRPTSRGPIRLPAGELATVRHHVVHRAAALRRRSRAPTLRGETHASALVRRRAAVAPFFRVRCRPMPAAYRSATRVPLTSEWDQATGPGDSHDSASAAPAAGEALPGSLHRTQPGARRDAPGLAQRDRGSGRVASGLDRTR